MEFYNNIDLTKNQILNVRIHAAASPPGAPVPGQIYYNTGDEKYYQYKLSTTTWVAIGNSSVAAAAAGAISVTDVGGVATLAVLVDGTTLEISSNAVRIKDAGVSTAKLADLAVTTIKLGTNAVTFSKFQQVPTMTVIGRVAAGTGDVSAIVINNSNTLTGASATTLSTDLALKTYIDNRISAVGSLKGGFDASVATNWPGTTFLAGDYWYVTGNGTVQGIKLNIGDMIIANKNAPSATLAADYIFLESNRDQATTTVLGLLMLATNAEVQTGSDANKAVTPASLSARTATEARTGILALATSAEGITGTEATKAVTPAVLTAVLNSKLTGLKAATSIGDGTNTTYTFPHGFNTKDVGVELYNNATGATVYADIARTTVNDVVITVGAPLTTNQLRVVVFK